MINIEPVRGRIPPPWFSGLPGLERIKALSDGRIARPPLMRLFGVKAGHVSPGTCTWTMPASEWLVVGGGIMEGSLLLETALMSAALSTQPAGFEVSALALAHYHMRPPRPHPGHLMARARVVNASRFFVLVSGEVEDSAGRGVTSALGQYRILPCDPAPPAVPQTLPIVEEPQHSSPDPWQRPVNPQTLPQPPFWHLLQADLSPYTVDAEDGFVQMRWCASEWFTRFSGTVPAGVIAQVMNGFESYGAPTLLDRDHTFAGLEQSVYFYRPLPADGREVELRHHTTGIQTDDPGMIDAQNSLHDADGHLIATSRALGCRIPAALRQQRSTRTTKRILASLVFSDIVRSTDHLARLGDAEWSRLKDQHHEVIRRTIDDYDGVEVDTAGDGFFVRFDSPAAALEYARSAQQAVARLGLELRIGVHTGECELTGTDVSGMAVHVAARLQGAAAPGEILVSEVVKALVLGSSWAFDERGERDLKGVPGTWRLFALAK